MGKTESGAVWLDPNKTSPYDFYQYWRNVDDKDVEKCLGLLTFLPMNEVHRLGRLQDAQINNAKETLAFEVTKIIHGEEEALKAQTAAKALFAGGAAGGSIPTTEIPRSELETGMDIISLLQKADLIPSRAEGRRLIQQGGVKLEGNKVDSLDAVITTEQFDSEGSLMIQKGKKVYHKIQLV